MKTLVLTITALVCLATSSFGWDELGHMMVATIAYDHLTPTVRQKVSTLLKLNPQYQTWVAGVPARGKDRMAFVKASLWADEIKDNNSGYTRDGTHNGYRPSGPTSAQNIGYADKLQHRYWHFVDLPFSVDDTTANEPAFPNLMTQITVFRNTLKSATASDDVKSYDLVWLLHLVGDAHQPLHAISRFSRAQTDGDEGGNLVAVCWKPCTKHRNLHGFWDEILGTSKNPNTAMNRVKQLPPVDPQLASISDEGTWIAESFEAARTQAYALPIGVGPGPYVLTKSYKAAAQKLAARRIALAGVRLANLLNDALH